MNEVLRLFIGLFVATFVNHIFVYSKTE